MYEGYNDPNADQGDELEIQLNNNVDNSTDSNDQTTNDGQSAASLQGDNNQTDVPDNFDPNSFGLNFKGQQVFPKDREHLINLAQQGWGYSQSMEQLNIRQKEMDKTEGTYSKYKEFDDQMAQDPKLAQHIRDAYSGYYGNQDQTQNLDDQTQNTDDPRIAQMQGQLQELSNHRDEDISNKADLDLQNTINTLKQQYPDQPWDNDTGDGTLTHRLIKHALDKGIDNIDLAYKDYMWDSVQANTTAATLKKQKEQTQKNFKNGVIDTGFSNATNKGNKMPGYSPGNSYGDLSQKAIQILGE